jgi:site-specific DNA-methyltransferase (adenine-specific)
MTARINEIQRVLKDTGVFYIHCDPTAGHYLKVVCDSIFIPRGGGFRNEIVWCYSGGGIPRRDFPRKHDTIYRYTKSKKYFYEPEYRPYTAGTVQRGRTAIKGKYFDEGLRKEGTPVPDWWTDIPKITSPTDPEKLGYPTQKHSSLLKRIIHTSSEEGDLVLDAFCGCGTTISVAEEMKRRWIGIDITYQAISVMLYRLRKEFGGRLSEIAVEGIPRDIESARALANREDDRVRKEFEKWAVLTYSNNYAVINERKGADRGIDGTAYFVTGKDKTGKVVFQAKSGGANRGEVAKLNSDRQRECAELGIFITLDKPSRNMVTEAAACGQYRGELMSRPVERMQLVTVEEILAGKRLDLPMSIEVLRQAREAARGGQLDLLDET